MHKADLPHEKAQEPNEEARQTWNVKSTTDVPSKNLTVSFAESTQSAEVTSSQNTCSFKEALSQPAKGISHLQKLQWLQKRRGTGLWVQCDDCNRWRYLSHIIDRHELPKQWFCSMNPDKSAGDCTVPEIAIKLRDEEDLIHSEYSAGSVVWARMPGWPWWPALVDDCPDTEQYYWLDGFSDIPTHYNVVFFDDYDVTRAWISPENLKPYSSNKKSLRSTTKVKKLKKRLDVAMRQADDADMLPLAKRLAKYSFINRYKGKIVKPKKISKKELLKFKRQLQRKLNIDFSDDSDTQSDESSPPSPSKKILLKKANNKEIPKTITDNPSAQNKSIEEIPKIDQFNAGNELTPAVNITEGDSEYFKQPNSLTVQIGSTSVVDTMNIDNDSSKTYVPENETWQSTADVTLT